MTDYRMQEYVLFGQISGESHGQVLQQCVGVSRMQPQAVEELHLVFKAKPPPGLAEIQKSSGGGSQGVVPPEVQKTRTMLNASLYYIQLVGTVLAESRDSEKDEANENFSDSVDVVMSTGDVGEGKEMKQLNWVLEFRDTPDPGKQPVTSCLLHRVPVREGEIMKFMEDFGFEYVSRYVVIGHKFYDQDITLFLQRIMQVSDSEAKTTSTDAAVMPRTSNLVLLDKSEECILSATIESSDGSNSELRERAVRQLQVMKENLKGAVNLTPGDRLALDTKVPVTAGQRR